VGVVSLFTRTSRRPVCAVEAVPVVSEPVLSSPVLESVPVEASADASVFVSGGEDAVGWASAGQAAGSVGAGVYVADPNQLRDWSVVEDSPTVTLAVPISQAVLEAACVRAFERYYEPPEDVAVMTDPEFRSYATFAAFGLGASEALDSVVLPQDRQLDAEDLRLRAVVRERVGTVFGFDAVAELDSPQAAPAEAPTAEMGELHAEREADEDGWEL